MHARLELSIVQDIRGHPNIVDVYCVDDFSYPDMSVLVMEECEGDLKPLRNPKMEYPQLLSDLRDGLVHMHKHRVIHLDIKPENVLKCKNPNDPSKRIYKYNDFGFAQYISSQTNSCTGQWRGTPDFMAPELDGDRCKVSAKADIYAIGLTIKETLRGYASRNQELDELVGGSIDKKFEDRFSVDEFSRKVDEILGN